MRRYSAAWLLLYAVGWVCSCSAAGSLRASSSEIHDSGRFLREVRHVIRRSICVYVTCWQTQQVAPPSLPVSVDVEDTPRLGGFSPLGTAGHAR